MRKILLLSICCLIFAGCSKNKPDVDHITKIARVGTHYLTLDEARNAIPSFVWKQDSAKALNKYKKEWIHEQLLLQKASDMKLLNKPAIQQKVQEARQKVLVNAVRKKAIGDQLAETEITNKEALQYYREHQKQFVLDERYIRFRHVSNKSVQFVRKARQALLSGTPWPKVARKYSDHAKKRIQQSKKYWPESAVLNNYPTLERYIASLDSGKVSPVRQINGTFHFVQLTGARDKGKYAKPEWIIDKLKNWLLLEKKQQYFNSFVKNLYLEAKNNNKLELYNVFNNSK